MPGKRWTANVSPKIARLVSLFVLTVGGTCVAVSAMLVLRGSTLGLLFSALGLMVLWVSILIDREARRRPGGGPTGFESPQVPLIVTRIAGLLVLALGGFLLVACLAFFFSDEPASWSSMANAPFALMVIWLGLVVDRDRMRGEARKQREKEGVREPDKRG